MHLQCIWPKPKLKMINYRRFLGSQQVLQCNFRGLDNSPLVIVKSNLCNVFWSGSTSFMAPLPGIEEFNKSIF